MSRVAFSNGMPSQFSILAFALATSFMLAGCGGGGGDDDSSVSTVAVAQLPGFKQEAKAMREQLDMAASVALADAQ